MRQRLAARLGHLFGLRIVAAEELGIFTRLGMWESADGGIVAGLKVMLQDMIAMLVGLLIPVFAIGTAIVFAARAILA